MSVGDKVRCHVGDYTIIGVIIDIFNYGAEFIDPTWTDKTIVVKSNGKYSHWSPSRVTVL